MKLTVTEHPDVLIVEPRVFEDSRGAFFEAYNQTTFKKLGLPNDFVQDNQSTSTKDVLRGLHYQIGQPQGKLIRVLRGEIFDVSIVEENRKDSASQFVCGYPLKIARCCGFLRDSLTVSSFFQIRLTSCTRRQTFTLRNKSGP